MTTPVVTPLTVFGSQGLSTSIPTAQNMTTTGGGSNNATKTTLIGTATGWGEVVAGGSTAAWPAAGVQGAPSGYGMVLDSTLLEGQQVVPGSWVPKIKSSVSVGTLTVNMVFRIVQYHAWNNTYTVLGTSTLSTQSITTTATIFTFPTITSTTNFTFGVGDKLYCDMWYNVTATTTGSGTAYINWHDFANTDTLGLSDNECTTPGYYSMMLYPVATPLNTPFNITGVNLGGPYLGAIGTKLAINGTPLSDIMTGASIFPSTEGNSGAWLTSGYQTTLAAIPGEFTAGNLTVIRLTNQFDTLPVWSMFDNTQLWQNMDYIIQQAYLNGQWVIIDFTTWNDILVLNGQNPWDQTLWAPMYAAAALHYRHVPNVAWYNLQNEPPTPNTQAAVNVLVNFYTAAANTIKANDPHHLICTAGLIGTNGGLTNWWQQVMAIPQITVAAFEVYDTNDEAQFPLITAYVATLKKPLVINETGMQQYNGDAVYNSAGGGFRGVYLSRHDWYTQTLTWARQQGVQAVLLWNYDHQNTGLTVSGSSYDLDASSGPAAWAAWKNAILSPPFFQKTAWDEPSSTIVQAVCDSVATHVIGLNSFYSSTASVLTGEATSLARVAALNDQGQLQFLLANFKAAFQQESAFLHRSTSYTAILATLGQVCSALDSATGGLSQYLVAHGVQVDPHFLDLFNGIAGASGLVALPAFTAFGPVNTNLAQFNVGGSGAGAFTAGTSQLSTYGNAPMNLVNIASGATGGSNGIYTITYSAYNMAGTLQTGLQVQTTMPASSASGTSVSTGVSGVAVTNITVSGATQNDVMGIQSALLRTAVY